MKYNEVTVSTKMTQESTLSFNVKFKSNQIKFNCFSSLYS